MRRKRNETKKTVEANTKTESAQTETNIGNDTNAGEFGSGDSETEKEIAEIMKPFEEPAEHSFQPETSPTETADDEFIPRRERKKRETKEEKKAREAQTERTFKLPGRLVNRVTNRLIGGIIVTVDGWISKTPVPAEYIYLDENELNDEDNVAMAEEFIKALKLTENPIAMYLASMGGLLITNYMMIKSLMAQAAKRGQTVEFEKEETKEETK